MHDPKKKMQRRNGDVALKKLRRLTIQADAAADVDRAKIIALLDDIESLRRRIQHECTVLDEEIRNAALRATAINAYRRNAKSSRRAYRSHH